MSKSNWSGWIPEYADGASQTLTIVRGAQQVFVPLPGRSVTILSMPPPRQVARSRVLPFGCLPLKMQAAAARRLRRSPIWSCRCQAGAQIPMCRLRSVVHNSAGHNCYPTPFLEKTCARDVPGYENFTSPVGSIRCWCIWPRHRCAEKLVRLDHAEMVEDG